MADDRPNILFIITGQHRADSLGCYGNTVCRTPNIDSLAIQGTRFENAFTCTAIGAAARASLLTGVMPHKHGLVANYERNIADPTELPDDLPPFSRYLQEANYQTGHVGKWHVGFRRGPEHYGFEGPHYFGGSPTVDHADYREYLKEEDLPPFTFHDEVRGTFPNGRPGNLIGATLDGPAAMTWPCYLVARTIQRLEQYTRARQTSDQPFFLGCHIFEPHLPYILPESYRTLVDPRTIPEVLTMRETFDNKPVVQRLYADHWNFDSFTWEEWQQIIAMYYGSVMLVDDAIGRLLVTLEDLNLVDNTIVIFTSDHGAVVGSHRMMDNGSAMYDDIYRIPLLARGPGILPNRICGDMVNLVDLPATFCDLAGRPAPEHFDGRSIRPLLQGAAPADWPDYIVAEFHSHHFPYPQRMIRTMEYKLIINAPDRNELYHLADDPHEMVNLHENPAHADIRRRLSRRLYDHLRDAGDNFYHWMASLSDMEQS